MQIDHKQFSPYRFSVGVLFIPLLAVVSDMVLRLFVTQFVVLQKGAALLFSGMDSAELEQQFISIVEENFHLIAIIYSILQIILFTGFFRLCRKRAKPYLFTRAPQKFFWLILPVLVLAGVGITGLWMNLVEALAHSSTYWQDVVESYAIVGQTLATGDSYLLQFLSVVVLVPLAEELLFRGILLSELKQVMKAEWAAFIAAIAFGVFHANVLQGVYAFLLGFIIGLVYVWTESIWAAIAMHMLFNFYGGSLLDLIELPQEEISTFHWYNLLPLLMIFVAIPLFIYLYQHRRPALTIVRKSRYAYALEALQLIEDELQEQEGQQPDRSITAQTPVVQPVSEVDNRSNLSAFEATAETVATVETAATAATLETKDDRTEKNEP